jgi:hypothetical protein
VATCTTQQQQQQQQARQLQLYQTNYFGATHSTLHLQKKAHGARHELPPPIVHNRICTPQLPFQNRGTKAKDA